MGDISDRPDATCTLDDVLITSELRKRPARAPDHEGEARALRALGEELALNPRHLLQKVAETVLDLCRADSAGVSILEPGGSHGIFRWQALAGGFAHNIHGTMPRETSPCGNVIARDEVLLFDGPERYFPALRGAVPTIYESLLAPWSIDGHPVGTLWALGHSPDRRFDAEDARLLSVLARFAAAAWQMTNALDAERSLRDVIARQATDAIERSQVENALRASLGERDALLKELHHRVKNNLQVVVSLLEMQARQAADGQALRSVTEVRDRVDAIASIHELLYQSGSFSQVDLAGYARKLVRHVMSLYEMTPLVHVLVIGEDITVDLSQAVPLGLMLNELVTNACKHAFPKNAAGELTIALQRDNGEIRLRVTDTGLGLVQQMNDRTSASQGMPLLRILAKQVGGTIAFNSEDGVSVDVKVPADPERS